jgi:hypothetical protein
MKKIKMFLFSTFIIIILMEESLQSIPVIKNYERITQKDLTFYFRTGTINISKHGEKFLDHIEFPEPDYVSSIITTKDSKNEEIDIGTMLFKNGILVRESINTPGENNKYKGFKALDEKYTHLGLRKGYSIEDCSKESKVKRNNMPILLIDRRFSSEYMWLYFPNMGETKLFVFGHPDISVLQPLDVKDICLWNKPDF